MKGRRSLGEVKRRLLQAGEDCEKGLDPHSLTQESHTHGGEAAARHAGREGLEEPLLHWEPEA